MWTNFFRKFCTKEFVSWNMKSLYFFPSNIEGDRCSFLWHYASRPCYWPIHSRVKRELRKVCWMDQRNRFYGNTQKTMSLHNSFWKYRFICQILSGFAKYNLLKFPDESSMICVMDSSVQGSGLPVHQIPNTFTCCFLIQIFHGTITRI